MKTDFLLAITQLAAERNLPKEVVFAAVEKALVSAFKKDDVGALQNISVKIHPVSGDVKVYLHRTVVEEATDPNKEISLAEAKRFKKDVQLGETVLQETSAFHAGRIAAQTAKQVVLQRLREAEREFIFGEYVDREGDIVSGVVHRIEPRQIVIDLGKTEGILPASEQVRTEHYRVGQRLKLFLLEVNRTNKGPRLVLSRSHPNLVRRLFELEVPEIYSGTVELKVIAREPGYRSKVAVAARQEGIDPVGSCVGLRGVRIQNVVNELNGERIDVIQWDPQIRAFVGNALSPAQVVSVDVDEKENAAVVVVADGQLSLAIGKEGQNARLAARLTGCKIDIKSASAAKAEKLAQAEEEPAEAAVEEEHVEVEQPPAPSVPADRYGMPLEQLGLSARILNYLRGNGITKVGELLEKSDQDLLRLRNFGQKSLAEVKQRIEALDLGARPLEEAAGAPWVEVEPSFEEAVELPGEVEEEVEAIPYEAPAEEAEPAEKGQIRFAEDIFAARAIGTEAKKKGKKKRFAREDKSEAGRVGKARKAQLLTASDEYQAEYEDYTGD